MPNFSFAHRSPRTLLALLCAGLFWVSLGSSCASAKRQVIDDQYLVEEVQFTGVKRFSKSFLIDYLYIGETRSVPFSPDYPFDQALLEADARRLQQLYQAHGYFDAVVTRVVPELDSDEQTALLKFEVNEGEPTKVVSVEFEWVEKPEGVDHTKIEGSAGLERDQTFEVSRYNESLGSIKQALQNLGYPLAEVTGKTSIDRVGREATTKFVIAPGPHAVIRSVRFEGLVDVPEYLLEREVRFAVGEPYSPARLMQMESSVKSLRVFRWVAATRPTEVGKDGAVEITMKVSEADPQSVRLGTEVSIDTIRWQEQLRADYTHTNVFGHLTRLDLQTTLGWAQLPNPFDTELNGPVVKVRPQFTKKGLLEDYLMWSETPQFQLGLNQGYQFYSLSNRFGVSRWFLGNIRLAVGHEVDYVNFFNLSPSLDPSSSLLGRDFRDPYLLSALVGKVQWFLVDKITEPTDGAILEASHGVAAGAVGSDFDFQKTTLTSRMYWQAAGWLQFAARLKTGWILPFGKNPSAPFNKRFYLGGSNTVRGWGSRRLSPRVLECDEGEEGEACDSIPVGGYTMVQGNLEARIKVLNSLFLVAFIDGGDVQTDDLVYEPDQWNYAAGPGIRVKTPIGLVRVDLGFRLNETGAFPGERGWAVHFGFGETL